MSVRNYDLWHIEPLRNICTTDTFPILGYPSPRSLTVIENSFPFRIIGEWRKKSRLRNRQSKKTLLLRGRTIALLTFREPLGPNTALTLRLKVSTEAVLSGTCQVRSKLSDSFSMSPVAQIKIYIFITKH